MLKTLDGDEGDYDADDGDGKDCGEDDDDDDEILTVSSIWWRGRWKANSWSWLSATATWANILK